MAKLLNSDCLDTGHFLLIFVCGRKNYSEDSQRSPRPQKIPKLTQTLLKISENHPMSLSRLLLPFMLLTSNRMSPRKKD